MMHIVGPITQIMGAHFHKPLALRLAQQAQVKHREILGEHGDDIDKHASTVRIALELRRTAHND